MADLRISQKHGVNPMIPICFFCNEERNEVALLGYLPGDKQAPMHGVIDYEPCHGCQIQMEQGVTLIEVNDYPNHEHQPPMGDRYYPTGRWLVMTEEGILNTINDLEMANGIINEGRAFIPPEVFEMLNPREEEA